MTVTGPGGAGKTRLACEVARQVAARFEDGAWLVELAACARSRPDPGDDGRGAGSQASSRARRSLPTLARVLARQQLLLVLDNCEHVISAAAALCAELVAACDDCASWPPAGKHCG